MTDAEPTPPHADQDDNETDGIRDRSVREVVERTRDVIRKTRELLENSRDLLERVRHRDGRDGEADADEASDAGSAADARPVDGKA